jgi:hypothetical protein
MKEGHWNIKNPPKNAKMVIFGERGIHMQLLGD